MEKYDLASDPCDYRLIRINNFLQALACVCNILAIFIDELRELAWLDTKKHRNITYNYYYRPLN